MAEDINASGDSSWKKITIAKANNEWQMANNIKVESVVEVETEYDSTVETPESESRNGGSLLVESQQKTRRKNSSIPANETDEQRTRRLAKMSAYAARRLANETPEEREVRLSRMSAYAARRLAQETPEQRARRLARMSAYAAKRLSLESPEQRASRLARMSAYAARRHKLRKTFQVEDHFLAVHVTSSPSNSNHEEEES